LTSSLASVSRSEVQALKRVVLGCTKEGLPRVHVRPGREARENKPEGEETKTVVVPRFYLSEGCETELIFVQRAA